MNHVLEIKELTKIYGNGKRAVDHLTFMVDAGDIYGFIGHNGAGKTTTMKACSGILEYDEGEIWINGRLIDKEPVECKREMAFVPDNPSLYEYLTGIQYLNFICDLYNVPADERKQEIENLSERLEISRQLGDLISSYSHGMKQKLALVAAFSHKPKLLILDEPFVGLDPMAFHTLKELMNELCSAGSAILFSSHVLDVVEKLCNKIAIIKNGVLISSGELEQILGNESLENVFLELKDKSHENN
ncbi:MAG: ABC transporter ATP-binding protein [Clostridium sp.]|jgi:ABC-2 type transport system ATP-binding protein|nr:ABC transporter ATP-binding protein [Clostridium sp.]